MLKGAIFDLDGVVVQTVPLHFKAWKKMFSEYKIDFSFEEYKAKVDGIPRVPGAKAILTGLSDSEIESAAARKQMYFHEFIDQDGITVFEGTVRLIDELRKNNIKTSVISSSKSCRMILDKISLSDKLDAILSGGDVEKGKPEPDIFLKATELMGIDNRTCVVFEDAALGVEAAKRAGMFCVGIDRYNDKKRLLRADMVLNDLEGVLTEQIQKWMRRRD